MRIDEGITEDVAILASMLFDVPLEETMRAYMWKWRKIRRHVAMYSVFLSIEFSLRTVAASKYINFTHETVRSVRRDTGLLAIIAASLLPGMVKAMLLDGTGESHDNVPCWAWR